MKKEKENLPHSITTHLASFVILGHSVVLALNAPSFPTARYHGLIPEVMTTLGLEGTLVGV